MWRLRRILYRSATFRLTASHHPPPTEALTTVHRKVVSDKEGLQRGGFAAFCKMSRSDTLLYVRQSFRAQRFAPRSAALVDGGLLQFIGRCFLFDFS